MTVHDVLLLTMCGVCDCVPHQVWVEVFTMLLSFTIHWYLLYMYCLEHSLDLRTWELNQKGTAT